MTGQAVFSLVYLDLSYLPLQPENIPPVIYYSYTLIFGILRRAKKEFYSSGKPVILMHI